MQYTLYFEQPKASEALHAFHTRRMAGLTRNIDPVLEPLEVLKHMDDAVAEIVSDAFALGGSFWDDLCLAELRMGEIITELKNRARMKYGTGN